MFTKRVRMMFSMSPIAEVSIKFFSANMVVLVLAIFVGRVFA